MNNPTCNNKVIVFASNADCLNSGAVALAGPTLRPPSAQGKCFRGSLTHSSTRNIEFGFLARRARLGCRSRDLSCDRFRVCVAGLGCFSLEAVEPQASTRPHSCLSQRSHRLIKVLTFSPSPLNFIQALLPLQCNHPPSLHLLTLACLSHSRVSASEK